MRIRANSYDCRFLRSNVIFFHLCTHMGSTRGFWATRCPDLFSPSRYFFNFILCYVLCSQGLEIFGPYLEDPIKFLDPFLFLLFFVCEFAFHYYHHHAKRVCWLCHFCIIVDLLRIATPFPHMLWFLPFYIADLLLLCVHLGMLWIADQCRRYCSTSLMNSHWA